MEYKLKVKVEQEGKGGSLVVTIDHKEFKWYWEFSTGKYLAFISVPNPNEWQYLFGEKLYDRNIILSEVAEEVCKQKCSNCGYEIYFDSIGIIQRNGKSGGR